MGLDKSGKFPVSRRSDSHRGFYPFDPVPFEKIL